MAVARFLQVSDLHLGAPFGWLPPDRRKERQREQRAALEKVVSLAIEQGVQGILFAGDLFDQEGVDADSLVFALNAFKVNGCPPVFISPGNHDPYSEASVYWSPRLLKARGFAWPDHVHVFSSPTWTSKSVPGMDEIRIWGRCFTPNVESLERPLAASAFKDMKTDASGIDIALFHGSREGKCPPGQKITAPFSDTEVNNAPFTYMAVGHYHSASRIDAHDKRGGGVRLAYAGSAVALGMSEIGLHGALEVRIDRNEGGKPFVEIDYVQLDARVVHEIEADVTAASSAEEVDRRVAGALDLAGVKPEDLAIVRLRGRMVKGVRHSGPGPELARRAFYLRLDLRNVRPDYDLDGYRKNEASTTEERFAKALLERLDAEKNPRERAILESALYYGLDAFRLREVVPAYEELDA